MKLRIVLAASALAFAASAQAANGDIGYIAASAGSSKFKINKSDIDNTLIGSGVQSLSSSLDDKDTGYKLTFGHQYNPNFAFELAYVDLGKAKYSATGTIGGSAGSGNGNVKVDGWAINLLGMAPLGESFSVFGKVGTFGARVKVDASVTSAGGTVSASSKATTWKWTYGLGASYNVTRSVAVRAEYEVFRSLGDANTGKGDVDLASLGVVFKF